MLDRLGRWIRSLVDRITPVAERVSEGVDSSGVAAVGSAAVTVVRWWVAIAAWLVLALLTLLCTLPDFERVQTRRKVVAATRLALAEVPTREELARKLPLLEERFGPQAEQPFVVPGVKSKISWTSPDEAEVEIVAPPEQVCRAAAATLRGKRPCYLTSVEVGPKKSTLVFRVSPGPLGE